MSTAKDFCEVLDIDATADVAANERNRVPHGYDLPGVLIARLYSFDHDDTPLVIGVPSLPGEIVRARTITALRRSDAGSEVMVLFERGEARRPIVVGVVRDSSLAVDSVKQSEHHVDVDADNERVIIEAEREIVLRCGGASITLTRAGKVIIKGSYVVSRSTGYNKIKGAAVDIN
jgi:hypothetical protein